MAKSKDNVNLGAEIGAGVKKGLQGLNTACSPKKRKVCIFLILIPLVVGFVCLMEGNSSGNETLLDAGIACGMCLGLYQFYVGKIKKGLIYTFTFGGLLIGCLCDLFRLLLTKTFKDANGFPVIY